MILVELGKRNLVGKFLSQVQELAKDLLVKSYAVEAPLLLHQQTLWFWWPGLSGAEPFLCCGGRVYENMDFDIDLNKRPKFPSSF